MTLSYRSYATAKRYGEILDHGKASCSGVVLVMPLTVVTCVTRRRIQTTAKILKGSDPGIGAFLFAGPPWHRECT